MTEWLIVIALAIIAWGILAIAFELARLRATVAEMLGSIAQASWRIRDELKESNKDQPDSN